MNNYQNGLVDKFQEFLGKDNAKAEAYLDRFLRETDGEHETAMLVWRSMVGDLAKAQADELWKNELKPKQTPKYLINEVVYCTLYNELVQIHIVDREETHFSYFIERQNCSRLWLAEEHLKPASEAPESCR